MDPLQRLSLQTEISKLEIRAYKDSVVMGLLASAKSAMTSRDWAKAEKLFLQAKDAYEPSPTVAAALVSAGSAETLAHARRMIEAAKVSVNGVTVRKVDALLPAGAKLEARK